MSSVPGTAAVTDALIALVAAATSAAVGDGRPPTVADPPFAVVYPLPGGDNWGPAYAAPQSGAALEFQITSVAVARSGVETFADIIRHALLDRQASGAFTTPLVVAGLVVLDRELVAYGGVDHERGVFNVADQYRIHVTL